MPVLQASKKAGLQDVKNLESRSPSCRLTRRQAELQGRVYVRYEPICCRLPRKRDGLQEASGRVPLADSCRLPRKQAGYREFLEPDYRDLVAG